MPHGLFGRILRIDLSSGRTEWIEISDRIARQVIGGCGLGTYLLLREGTSKLDPYDPGNPLIFSFSPLVGSPLTTSAKFGVISKSPLTDRINDSMASGRFAIAGKQLGCDAIMIVGAAMQRSVLVIHNGEVTIADADDVWGLACDASQAQLKKKYGEAFSVATIGPAGEKRVRFATISHDGRHAGRGGNGAVMGSKNLKAILVQGEQRPTWAHRQELFHYARRLSTESLTAATAKYRELGTASNLLTLNRLAALPSYNFRQATFEEADRLSVERLTADFEKIRKSCACCTIGCEHQYKLNSGDPTSDHKPVRMEYENLFALGPLVGVGDPAYVLQASRLCDDYGMDTISVGGTIGFAMECAQRGLIDEPELRFGDGGSLLRCVHQIANRQAFGNSMAEGSRRLAAEIGQSSIRFAPQVKGLEMPGYEPRSMQAMAVGYAVGTRGADHNRSGAYELDLSERIDRRNISQEAIEEVIEIEDRAALMDSLILCKFIRGVLVDFYSDTSDMLNLITGWEHTPAELEQIAKGITVMKKVFNMRAGWSPDEDSLPDRFFDDELAHQPAGDWSKEKLQKLIRVYNLGRGYTADGHVTRSLIDHLNLNECLEPVSKRQLARKW